MFSLAARCSSSGSAARRERCVSARCGSRLDAQYPPFQHQEILVSVQINLRLRVRSLESRWKRDDRIVGQHLGMSTGVGMISHFVGHHEKAAGFDGSWYREPLLRG
jgi:hypothetical protein